MKRNALTLALLGGLSLSGAAQAALHDRGNGLIYDDQLNITWLQNANLLASNSFGLVYGKSYGNDANNNAIEIFSNGQATWGGAQIWIQAMNSANYLGHSDWRLPATNPINGVSYIYSPMGANQPDGSADEGFNVSAPGTPFAGSHGSEMAYTFYQTLGNSGYYTANGLALTGCAQGLFGTSCLQNAGPFVNLQSWGYWSGTVYAPDTTNAWHFSTYSGGQGSLLKGDTNYAWAVLPGDIAAVPEPEDWTLLVAGLGLVGWAGRRRP